MSTPEAASSLADESGGLAEARLVQEVLHGDQAAFGELVRRYERRVLKVIRRFIRDEDLAADLSQETFLKAHQGLSSFDPSLRFGPWLFRIAVNVVYDHLRKVKRRGWWPLFSDRRSDRPVEPPAPDPRDELDLRQEVQLVLEQVPEQFRTVLILRDLENFSTSEIAAILRRKEATIRWRLAQARTRFQHLWTKRMDGRATPLSATRNA